MGNRFLLFYKAESCASAHGNVIITLSPSEASGESAYTYMQLQVVFGRTNAATVHAQMNEAICNAGTIFSGKLV